MTSRTTSKGGKTGKGDTQQKNKHDKSDTGKTPGDNKQNSGDHARSKNDDPGIKEKVKQVMDMTRRSEEEVCYALHECDNDIERAVNMLYENMSEGEWETSCKKKKNRQTSTSKAEPEEAAVTEGWIEDAVEILEQEKPRIKGSSGPPPRLHGRHTDNRSWRGRENKENGRNNFEDVGQDRRDRRGGRPGNIRGGNGGRGRGGGRAGSRYPPRTSRNSFSNNRTTSIDTWDNSATWETTTITNSLHTNYNTGGENWDEFPAADDWSTEEYTGSLADTKVFTPSMALPMAVLPGPMETASDSNFVVTQPVPIEGIPPIVGTLNAAQTQYLNQLTQQSNENMKAQQYVSSHQSQTYGNTTPQPYSTGQAYINAGTQHYNSTAQQYATSPVLSVYNTNYGVNSGYGNIAESQAPTHQPTRAKTQRARVPPPSKIPASAVEMPGDLNSSIGYLDVQFGAMDFMSDTNSFDAPADSKYSPTNDSSTTNQISNTNVDMSQANQNPALDTTKSTQSSITSALSQNLTNVDNIPQNNEHISGIYNTTSRSTAANTTQTVSTIELNKQTEPHSYTQASTYNSYQPKTSTYQAQGYNSATYNAAQTTTNNYVSSNTPSSYNPPNTGNTYQNSYPSSVSSYQSNTNVSAFPTISQANSYPPTNQYQQTSQSVYGTNTGLNSNTNYAGSANQYSNYNANSKIVKEASYDNNTSVSSNTAASGVNNTSTISQATTTSTKPTTALAKNSNNVVSNIAPAGVTPVMGTQYIMGQVPYFQQPIYSFEDMQLIQQRIPHMTTGYYDMGYQTPTTLAAVRDGTLGNVAYSISDGRFTRGDTTSPVPSTLSQQTSTLTQAHQAQPMLAAQTGGAPFFYTPYNPMQPTYQFGAVYPQIPAVTNAHGSTTSQYPKPATYGSAYGSGYDPLTQSQDYSKGAYVGNTQGQNKTSANASSGVATGNDLTAMYGKSHTALGKVNSYDKQGFHSGTPPPFTGALHGNQSTGLAPSGTNYAAQMFIPTMPPHQQHHSTTLIHQPLHQDSGNSSGQRSQVSTQGKSGGKQGYPNSYWNQS